MSDFTVLAYNLLPMGLAMFVTMMLAPTRGNRVIALVAAASWLAAGVNPTNLSPGTRTICIALSMLMFVVAWESKPAR